MSPSNLPQEDWLLAAELAIGLLEGADRDTAEARLAQDPAFAAEYAFWRQYAAAAGTGNEQAPAGEVWQAIAAALPANDVGAQAPAWSLRRGWQIGTMVSTAAAIVLGVLLLERPGPPASAPAPPAATAAPRQPLAAVLTSASGPGVVTITYDPSSGGMVSVAHQVEIGRHSAQLWVIPADQQPRSLGIISAERPKWLSVPATGRAVLAAGATLAISVEPVGGSPTGKPTGAILLTGKMLPT